MNVLIWTDMEGISGITVMEQILPEHFLYNEGRRLYTEDINAAARVQSRLARSDRCARGTRRPRRNGRQPCHPRAA
ncbi:MAG: M55 family metallopeptidase [Holophaga sp.]|nr:M55 family metallopeptidase [Holophaga sp.]